MGPEREQKLVTGGTVVQIPTRFPMVLKHLEQTVLMNQLGTDPGNHSIRKTSRSPPLDRETVTCCLTVSCPLTLKHNAQYRSTCRYETQGDTKAWSFG